MLLGIKIRAEAALAARAAERRANRLA